MVHPANPSIVCENCPLGFHSLVLIYFSVFNANLANSTQYTGDAIGYGLHPIQLDAYGRHPVWAQ